MMIRIKGRVIRDGGSGTDGLGGVAHGADLMNGGEEIKKVQPFSLPEEIERKREFMQKTCCYHSFSFSLSQSNVESVPFSIYGIKLVFITRLDIYLYLCKQQKGGFKAAVVYRSKERAQTNRLTYGI